MMGPKMDTVKTIKNDLKNRTGKRVYLLYGEERYLLNYYARAFTDTWLDAPARLMNRDVFDGKAETARIMDAANTMPFLSDTRLVYARDTRLFTAGRKDETEAMAEYLPDIPESTILIFVESEVDKRNRLYKKTAELGRAVAFVTPAESELTEWVMNIFKKKGQTITAENARRLLRTVLHNMEAVYAEADKLSDYAGERKEITAEDIQTVCSPSLETRIFDLVDAVGYGRGADALGMYRRMLIMKEQPLVILAMLARQFRLVLQCKAYGEKKAGSGEIAKALDLRGFIVDECLRQSRHFTVERLIDALRDCGDLDLRVKTGLINVETGVETLIIRYAAGGAAPWGGITP